MVDLSWLDHRLRCSGAENSIMTNWVVITGGPASGKSTVINLLASYGNKVVKEAARKYQSSMREKDISLSRIRSDQLSFQRSVLKIMYHNEISLPHDQLVFFDRGIPDGIAFYRIANLDPDEIFKLSMIHRYKKIFIFDLIPDSLIKFDSIRLENHQQSKEIDTLIEIAYKEVGYSPIRVPVMSVHKRAEYILKIAKL